MVLSGEGTIATFSVVHASPSPSSDRELPYVLALIDTREGVRILTNIVESDPDMVRIGHPVSVVFEKRGERILPQFRLVE